MAKGLDVGTSFIVLSKKIAHDTIEYKDFRDAFYVITPSNPIAAKMIEKGLAGKIFVKDQDGSFIVLGKDAIEKALEKNESAKRPMYRGIVSPKEKDSKKVLSFILKEVVGKPSEPNEKLVFCVPAQPIDQTDEDFDVSYHEDIVKSVLSSCGYSARSINEAEALCYGELEEDDYTGIGLSWGAGMVNTCIMLNGESILTFSTTKSGDWIDHMSAIAVSEPDGIVQSEKENGKFTVGQTNPNAILSAVSAYYERLIDYTTKQLVIALTESKSLPKFKKPLTIVVAGGTSQADGFVSMFESKLKENKFPLPIKVVKQADDPLHAVSKGCLIAAIVL
jgi:hypothetical protein